MGRILRSTISAALLAWLCGASGALAGEWQYSNTEDKMRGERFDYAILDSTNKIEFDFPYNGGSTLQLVVRKKNGKVDAILLSVTKGQILCSVMECKGR